MLKLGSRLYGAAFAVAGLMCIDARLAFAQQTTQPPAQPQSTEGIQEVVVTAQRREENLQTTPIAITALSADALNKQGVTDFAGVAEASTSLNFTPYPSSSNTLILYMRGQGVADANQITQDGSVGLYEDGFYIARPQAETFDLADVERVEVLRGPQGTLYGRNTTGGAVNIISQKPTGDLDFKISLDGGNRDYARVLATVNLPKVAEGLSSKITLLYSNLDGNVSNSGGEDYNRENQKGGRLALRWDTGGPFTADYFFEIGELDSTPIYYQDAALYGVLPGYPATNGLASSTWEPLPLPESVAKFNADGLTLNLKLGDSAILKSLTGYRGLDSRFTQNYAGAFTNPATAGGPFGTGAVNFGGQDVVQSNQISQEFQLVGNVGTALDYVAGLYYFQENANHGENVTIDVDNFDIHQLTERYVHAYAKSRAIYGQATYKITEPLSITVGGRYTKDDRDAERFLENFTNGIPGLYFFAPSPTDTFATARNNLSFSKFNPAGTLNMAWTPDINTYLRIATGYKAGGSSEAGPPGAFGQTFAPENVTTYELGLKSFWLDRTLRANVAVFHSQFKDMQLQFDVSPANLAIVDGYNAGSARVNGAELELLYSPVADFTVGINDTYLQTQFTTVTAEAGTIFDPAVNPLSPYTVGQNISPLFRLPYAPNNILGLNADWTMLHAQGGSLELFLDYRYQGRQYDTAPTGVGVPGSEQYYSIAPYGVMNGKLTWNFDTHDSKKTMRVSLWAKNMLDKQYPAHVIGQGPIIPVCTRGGPGTGISACLPVADGGTIDPVAGYTFQSTAWAPHPMYGVQFQYGF
jgi:iron complex outermembrane recepter protein